MADETATEVETPAMVAEIKAAGRGRPPKAAGCKPS